ncbi:MAG: 2-hydroxyacid dehydrogenase [Opitutales bacterium]
MNIAVFSSKPHDRIFLDAANGDHQHTLTYFEARLSNATASLAQGYPVVSAFVNDVLDEEVLSELAKNGTRLIALRSAGFNNVELKAAERLGLTVVRVPAYSPHAVAEHTIALMLGLNRRIHRAYNRVREGNFSLDGLLGFDFYGKTAGVVGTGKIGAIVARLLAGFGCRVLAYDLQPSSELEEAGITFVTPAELLERSHILSLHCPLTPETHHLINGRAIQSMKDGVMLINTSRGGLVDTAAVIHGLKSGKIGYVGLDVYEEEGDLFFEDLSQKVIQDDVFMRLLTFPNVLITGHQAFFTREAVQKIAETTIANITAFEDGSPQNSVTSEVVVRK